MPNNWHAKEQEKEEGGGGGGGGGGAYHGHLTTRCSARRHVQHARGRRGGGHPRQQNAQPFDHALQEGHHVNKG